jgi:peptidoglycan lytic transglycosylase G
MRSLLCAAAVALAVVPAAVAAAPKPVLLRISFPEGFSARQMADRVAAVRRIAIAKRHVTPVLTGRSYAAALARTPPPAAFRPYMHRRSIEGFLFPSLYVFGPSDRAPRLIELQLEAFDREWSRLDLSGVAANPYEVLTIASMVEREAAVPSERPLIAAVIYNRLEQNMPLGIDATLRYGLGIQGTRPLTGAQLRSDSPYNTRRFTGLPPTPIGNPGFASLRAAAHPAPVDYLYYLRVPGTVRHFFTADYAEFCAKVAEYGYRGC